LKITIIHFQENLSKSYIYGGMSECKQFILSTTAKKLHLNELDTSKTLFKCNMTEISEELQKPKPKMHKLSTE